MLSAAVTVHCVVAILSILPDLDAQLVNELRDVMVQQVFGYFFLALRLLSSLPFVAHVNHLATGNFLAEATSLVVRLKILNQLLLELMRHEVSENYLALRILCQPRLLCVDRLLLVGTLAASANDARSILHYLAHLIDHIAHPVLLAAMHFQLRTQQLLHLLTLVTSFLELCSKVADVTNLLHGVLDLHHASVSDVLEVSFLAQHVCNE